MTDGDKLLQELKELDDLLSMHGCSRLYQQIKLAEQIGTAQLLKAKHKPSLIKRLREIVRR